MMKRILLLRLSVVVSPMMMADDVTPEEALQQATQFVQNRVARGNGPRLAPGVQPKLTLASRVSDLYVFNVGSDAGFIIVSNDDCAVPILGYSDSGSFDANNMPDNMRAWLQGYADEIAWAKANHVKPVANAPKRAALGNPVGPLLTTYWDQGTPYNDLCPLSGSTHTLTGCVATAMAQVMNYHQWPEQTTIAIPSYTTYTSHYAVSAISANTTIDWQQMKNAYGDYCSDGGAHLNAYETYTYDQAAAVAQLMLYCGASVEMDYGLSFSGAYTADVAKALKNYFGYNENVKYVVKSDYTAANWATLMYHELENSRPIVYGGESTGGGHEFVCDGYKYESDKDYFHINWGWAGLSNGYFTLSALDPEAQGYGGSADYTGFNSGQEAVIGIAKNTVSVTLADVSPKTINLAFNSVSPQAAIVGQSQTFAISVTNNSSDDFDNRIGLMDDNNNWLALEYFQIASGATQTCELSFVPSNSGTMKVWIMKPVGGSSFDSNTPFDLTVYPTSVSGTMNGYGWSTFSSNCPLDFTNVSGINAAYIVTGNEGTTINKTAVTKVPANTGLLLKGTINGAYTIPVTLDETDNVSGNKLVPVPSETIVSAATDANTTNYVLSVQNEKVVFASIGTTSATVPAGRAYLTLTSVAAPWFSLDGGDATGINEVRGNMDDVRDVFYDLSGRRVENPTKGVYIVNGRKVVIK